MPSPRRKFGDLNFMNLRTILVFATAIGGALVTSQPAHAQIASVTASDGRRLFVNAEPSAAKLSAKPPAPKAIYLQGEISFMGKDRPAMSLDRDGADKLVREAAERHKVDPALVRAVIETESNWNPAAR